MSNEMILGGYILEQGGARVQLPMVLRPLFSSSKSAIEKVAKVGRGVVVLRYQHSQEIGPDELALYIDSGHFMPMLSEIDEESEVIVRTLNTANLTNEKFSFVLGEPYPTATVTHDLDLIYSIVKEFIETGKVSRDILA